MTPRAVLIKTGLKLVNTARPVNTAYPKTTVYKARPISCFLKLAQSTVKRPYQSRTTLTNKNFNQKNNTAKENVYTAKPKAVNTANPKAVNTARSTLAVVNVVRAKQVNAVKALACWVWRPTKLNSASITFKRHNYGHLQKEDQGYVDSGCSRHMAGNMSYLSDFKEFDGGYVTFRGGAKEKNNMKRGFSGEHTPLFPSMIAIQAEEGEEPIPNVVSSSHQKTQTPRQALNQVTELPHTSEPIPNVADEAVYEEWDDRVERAITTAASLDAEQASGNINRTQSTVMPNVPLPQGIGVGGSPRCQESIGVPLLRLGLRGYLHSPMIYLSQEFTHLEVMRQYDTIRIDDFMYNIVQESGELRGRLEANKEVTLVTPTHSQEDQPEDQLGVFSAANVLADAAKENVHTYTRRRREVSTGSGGINTASRLFSTAKESVSTAGASMLVSTAGMVQEVNISIPSPVVVKDKGKGKMEEYEDEQTKRTKLQQEQERLGHEAAARLQEELDEEERQRMARVHEAAQSFTKEEWENIRARVEADEELSRRLQAEERNKYSEVDQAKMLVDLINQRKKYFSVQKAEAKRNKPMTQAQ
ncbi:hypothetical protein Tco_1012106 [Tanacetum coccineum]